MSSAFYSHVLSPWVWILRKRDVLVKNVCSSLDETLPLLGSPNFINPHTVVLYTAFKSGSVKYTFAFVIQISTFCLVLVLLKAYGCNSFLSASQFGGSKWYLLGFVILFIRKLCLLLIMYFSFIVSIILQNSVFLM